MEFFLSQRENAISSLRTFSITCGDRKWRDIPVPFEHLDFSRCPEKYRFKLPVAVFAGTWIQHPAKLCIHQGKHRLALGADDD